MFKRIVRNSMAFAFVLVFSANVQAQHISVEQQEVLVQQLIQVAHQEGISEQDLVTMLTTELENSEANIDCSFLGTSFDLPTMGLTLLAVLVGTLAWDQIAAIVRRIPVVGKFVPAGNRQLQQNILGLETRIKTLEGASKTE
ncbi:hypothetical protein K2X40_04000 [Candidatus Babeliales bacterium]|nr:hypothetical protein [Candidatus Babeliales bacterium]